MTYWRSARSFGALFALGAAAGIVAGRTASHGADKPADPNVVVLRGEKQISLVRDDIPLSEMAKSFGEQTDRSFAVAETLAKADKHYSFALSGAPLSGVLAATARMAVPRGRSKGLGTSCGQGHPTSESRTRKASSGR
jgi:hypothetical protein